MSDQQTQILFDKQACTELIYRLARGLDRCDRDLLRSVFHPDATDDHGEFKGSASDFVEWAVPFLESMRRTQHTISNVVVDVDGDFARSECYLVAYHDWEFEGEPARHTSGCRYMDSFERRNGEWKMSHRHMIWDWSAWDPMTERWDRTTGPNVYGQRGVGDPVYAHLAGLGS